MNATLNDIDEDVQSLTAEGPGRRLRTLRESANLELSRVSVLLHLSEEKLMALEADDYAKLPGPVFIQGYLRNYARLLGVPVEPVLNAYHAASPESIRIPELKITQVSHEVGSGHALVRLVTWGMVIGLILMVVVWWRGYLQWPMQGSDSPDRDSVSLEQLEEIDNQETDAVQKFPVVEVDADGAATLALPQALSEPTPPAPDSTANAESPEMAAGSSERVQPDSTTSAAVADSSAAVPARPVGATAESREAFPVAAERVVVEYGGTSWTKIEDASGTFKLEGSMNAGTRHVLRGTPPYRLVLGNASVVKIFVDGRAFDLTPYSRGNVARFTLEPESRSE